MNKTLKEQFNEVKKSLVAVKYDEWWQADEGFILDFIQSYTDRQVEQARKEEKAHAALNALQLRRETEKEARVALLQEIREKLEQRFNDNGRYISWRDINEILSTL